MVKLASLLFFLVISGSSAVWAKPQSPLIVVLYTVTGLELGDDYNNLNLVAEFAFTHFDKENDTKTDVRIIGIDDRDDPAHALEELKKLVKTDRPLAILGPIYSNVAMGIKSYIEQVKIPLISIFATHNDLTKNAKYVFQICASNRKVVKTMADFMIPEAQKHKLTIHSFKDLSDDYSIDAADDFRKFLGDSKVAYNEVLFRGNQGLDHLQDLNSKIWTPTKSDIIFLPDRDDVAGHVIAAIESEPYMITTVDAVTFLGIAKKIKSEKTHIRLVTTSQWLPGKSAYSKGIEEEFQKRFHHPMSITTALAYDAAFYVASALNRSKTKGLPLVTSLRDSTKLTGVTGTLSFGPDGQRDITNTFLKESFIE